jgi:hypothetical protein
MAKDNCFKVALEVSVKRSREVVGFRKRDRFRKKTTGLDFR